MFSRFPYHSKLPFNLYLLQLFVIPTFISCTQTVKKKEISFLKEALFGKDKENSDLKEKLSQLQQSWQRSQLDFAEQMAAMDEKLQEARKTIDELKGGANLSVMRNTTKLEESQSGLQFFNGEYVTWNGISMTIFSLQACPGKHWWEEDKGSASSTTVKKRSFHNSDKIKKKRTLKRNCIG